MRRRALAVLTVLIVSGCQAPRKLTVAAASNLTGVFDEIGRAFTLETGIEVVFSFGSTAALAQQVEQGAPVDVFAAADVEHIDLLVASKKLESRSLYARGQLALWAPGGGVSSVNDLARPEIKFVAIAQPELAPYGQAAVETLRASSLWDAVQPKLVYASNISQAKQLAATGNADAAFTAYSLVLHEAGSIVRVDAGLHEPLEQALGVVAGGRTEDARRFSAFVLGPKGRDVLKQNGYLVP